MEIVAQILTAVAWPIVVLAISCIFRHPISQALWRVRQIRASSKGVELVLDRLEEQGKLPSGSRTDLSGLSASDIWALDDFANNKINKPVNEMKPAQRVAARTLRDAGLIEISVEGPNRRVAVTPLGRQILEAASSLL